MWRSLVGNASRRNITIPVLSDTSIHAERGGGIFVGFYGNLFDQGFIMACVFISVYLYKIHVSLCDMVVYAVEFSVNNHVSKYPSNNINN